MRVMTSHRITTWIGRDDGAKTYGATKTRAQRALASDGVQRSGELPSHVASRMAVAASPYLPAYMAPCAVAIPHHRLRDRDRAHAPRGHWHLGATPGIPEFRIRGLLAAADRHVPRLHLWGWPQLVRHDRGKRIPLFFPAHAISDLGS